MKKTILIAVAMLGLRFTAAADIIALWDFNSSPSDGVASTGTTLSTNGLGVAVAVGGVTADFNAPGGSSDPLLTDLNNSDWRMVAFPAQGTANKTTGAQFTLDTTGYGNITMHWDQNNTGPASKYYRIQYSVDNGTNWVDKDVIINPSAAGVWNNPITNITFNTVTGANNNPAFKVRLVSEFQSTAVGGVAGYVQISGGSYTTAANLRLDMVTFSGDILTGNVGIITDPVSQTVAVGQPVTFSVVAGGGTTAIGYQWRHDTSPIAGATNSSYSIAAARHLDAGAYDVVVTNGFNSTNSAIATLTVRDPLNLVWNGTGSTWDSVSSNWLDSSSLQITAFTVGDNVLFDDRGAAASTVSLAETLVPSSVTVAGSTDYTLTTAGGKIAGNSGLTKQGANTLIMDVDNTYTGPTVIQSGILQLGAGNARGSAGSGPITNNGALLFNHSDNITVVNNLSGGGGITNLGKTVILAGSNVFDGPITAPTGDLSLSGNPTVNSTDPFVIASTATGVGGTTRFGVRNGVTIGAGTTLHLTDLFLPADNRTAFYANGGTNISNAPIIVDGTGLKALQTDSIGTLLQLNGNISGGPNLTSSASLFLRGTAGTGVLNGTINLPNTILNKTDAGTWVINSTGNSWSATVVVVGTLRLGVNNALPLGGYLQMGQVSQVSTFDLAGFNQQLGPLVDSSGTLGTEIVTNSSATTDSLLTVGSGAFSGIIADSAAGPKTSLTVNGTTFTLAGSSTYSGGTTVAAGTLALTGVGAIPNSAVINLAGGSLDVSARSDATLTLGAAQKLQGNGTFTITGNLVNNGTVALNVNKSGGAVSNDKVSVSGAVAYGGTLKLILSGDALLSTDTISAFSAGSYAGGAFTAIDPATPAPGLTWDTSTLASDGILRITGSGQPTIGTTVLSPTGSNLTFGGTGGPASASFSVVTSTNATASLGSWTVVQTGSFDASGNFSVTITIPTGEPQHFYTLRIP